MAMLSGSVRQTNASRAPFDASASARARHRVTWPVPISTDASARKTKFISKSGAEQLRPGPVFGAVDVLDAPPGNDHDPRVRVEDPLAFDPGFRPAPIELCRVVERDR